MTPPVAVILQSSYIPWKGYFDLIAASDIFVLFDDVQFTKRDWRNRNRIKTAAGPAWLTIPVVTKGRYGQPIDQVEIADGSWAEAHWRTISHAYARAPCFGEFAPFFEDLYRRAAALNKLSAVNRLFLDAICTVLSMTPNFVDARTLSARGAKTDRLLDICEKIGAGSYLSGPAARAYLDPEKFSSAGVELHYIDYSAYQSYNQLHGSFDPHVSILDLIFMAGAAARNHLRFAGGS